MNSAGSLCSLTGRYDNPTPTRFLTPRDFSKIPAQVALSRQSCWGEGGGGDVIPAERVDTMKGGAWVGTTTLSKLGRKYHHD